MSDDWQETPQEELIREIIELVNLLSDIRDADIDNEAYGWWNSNVPKNLNTIFNRAMEINLNSTLSVSTLNKYLLNLKKIKKLWDTRVGRPDATRRKPRRDDDNPPSSSTIVGFGKVKSGGAYEIKKTSPKCWTVINKKTGAVKAKCTSEKKAKAQLRLLYGLESGWTPSAYKQMEKLHDLKPRRGKATGGSVPKREKLIEMTPAEKEEQEILEAERRLQPLMNQITELSTILSNVGIPIPQDIIDYWDVERSVDEHDPRIIREHIRRMDRMIREYTAVALRRERGVVRRTTGGLIRNLPNDEVPDEFDNLVELVQALQADDEEWFDREILTRGNLRRAWNMYERKQRQIDEGARQNPPVIIRFTLREMRFIGHAFEEILRIADNILMPSSSSKLRRQQSEANRRDIEPPEPESGDENQPPAIGRGMKKRQEKGGYLESFKRKPGLLPPPVRKILMKIGDEKINSLRIVRTPLSRFVSTLLNVISLGAYQKAVNESPYDSMFHLAMIINGKYVTEKNEVIKLYQGNPVKKNSETFDLPVSKDVSIGELFDNGRKQMGDVNFTNYDARTNNCQDFLLGLLKGSSLLTEEARKFIKQDPEVVFKKMPSLSEKIGRFLTDVGAVGERVMEGEGKPCWKGYEMIGMKRKSGKQVPNCVPMKETWVIQGGRLFPVMVGAGPYKIYDSSSTCKSIININTGKVDDYCLSESDAKKRQETLNRLYDEEKSKEKVKKEISIEAPKRIKKSPGNKKMQSWKDYYASQVKGKKFKTRTEVNAFMKEVAKKYKEMKGK